MCLPLGSYAQHAGQFVVSLGSVIANYAALQETFEESIDTVTDTEVKSRLIGVSAQMKTINFLFGTLLGELILKHSDKPYFAKCRHLSC